jgi:hypothetical protein
MKRILWMGIGVAIGVIAFRKITEAQSALGPEGLNRAVGRLADGIYDFADAVRDGMQERETELRTALGIDSQDVARRERLPSGKARQAVRCPGRKLHRPVWGRIKPEAPAHATADAQAATRRIA